MPRHSIKDDSSIAPTLWSTDYGAARIRLAVLCWAIAAVILVAGVIWLGAPGTFDISSPDFFPLPAGFAGAFTVFGFVHLGSGLRDLARRRKAGLSRLEANPPRLGKKFSGRIRTANDMAATGPYTIRLACEHHTTSEGTDESTRTHRVILWEKSDAAPQSTRSDLGIPFAFSIPANGVPSHPGTLANSDSVVWKLSVSAPTSGLNYAADFLLDVQPEGGADEASSRSVDEAFRGYTRPEQPGARFLRFAIPIIGALLVLAGGYASLNQALHSWHGVAVSGTILTFNRPQAEVALESGPKVVVPGISSHNQWQEGQQVVVVCRADGAEFSTCRMDTGSDRWIDAVATLAIGLALTAVGVWLWWRRRRLSP